MTDQPALVLEDVTRSFTSGDQTVHALAGVSFQVARGEAVSVIGPSGSGKSTLLGLVAGLDRPDSGRVLVDGQDLALLDEDRLSDLRASHIGVVFQQFRLLPDLSAHENARLPLELRGVADAADRARAALEQVGLGHRLGHRPNQLSGGEQQRVAIARALAIEPAVLVADEPTGSLDGTTGAEIADRLLEAVRARDVALLLVTHDPQLAERADRTLALRDGRFVA